MASLGCSIINFCRVPLTPTTDVDEIAGAEGDGEGAEVGDGVWNKDEKRC